METLKGIYKVQEEMNELGTVLAKFGPFPDGQHPSPDYGPDYTLHQHMCDEIADTLAALTYFIEENELLIDPERVNKKIELFRTWGLTGLQVRT